MSGRASGKRDTVRRYLSILAAEHEHRDLMRYMMQMALPRNGSWTTLRGQLTGTFNLAPPIGELVDDRYLVLRRLAKGGQGEALLVYDDVIATKVPGCDYRDALVCMKRPVSPEQYPRFEREAQMVLRMQRCSAPYIISGLHLIARDGTVPYLIMEYSRQGDLERYCSSCTLSTQLAIQWTCEIATAVAHMHHAGYLHRDIKPSNALVFGDHVKLCDLAYACEKRDQDNSSQGSAGSSPELGGTGCCTPKWSAPELLAEGSIADEQSDIFGLAAILRFMLTGQPVREPTQLDTFNYRKRKLPVPQCDTAVAGVSRELQTVLDSCLSSQRSIRMPDARALIQRLLAVPEACLGSFDHVLPPKTFSIAEQKDLLDSLVIR